MTSNRGHHSQSYYTCCECYADLWGYREGVHACPKCGAQLFLRMDWEPVYSTRLADEDEIAEAAEDVE